MGALESLTNVAVAIVGAIGIIGGAWVTTVLAVRLKNQKKELQEVRQQLSDVFQVVHKPSAEFGWLYDKYSYLDSAFDGYCVINPMKQEEYISDNICRIIGRRRHEIGKTVETLKQYVNPVDFDSFEMMVRNLMDRKVSKCEGLKRIRMADGRWARFGITAVLDGPFILTIWRFEGHEKPDLFR